ncbi:uncharacterized protein A1O9_08465 [Exophiala aquamarina CBS 119918]|uniref:Nephrocystin 3-like N-terminal domain-containing protein n=1 Tax=Exophiala aquamarina CBS 119918 TaxID=1182545 RepID=A0A072PJM7_9EURO|nr:uncharacterized protein A1O9_08465 [Exophiala aquamarina CBS 119918]KEF55715.1 hypothetical protein A1O9_08465 [Exophiala aquamarina CBS 119918]
MEKLRTHEEMLLDMQTIMAQHEVLTNQVLQKTTENEFDGADDIEEFDRATESREEGTAEWIFNDQAYRSWQAAIKKPQSSTDRSSQILLVTGTNSVNRASMYSSIPGMPGSGKTVLAAAVVNSLQALNGGTDTAVCFHFFSYLNSRKMSVTAALQALCTQLLNIFSTKVPVLEAVSFLSRHAQMQGRTKHTISELQDLLSLILQRINACYIVVDALDECEDPVAVVNRLAAACQDTKTQIIIFSRPNVDSFRSSNGYLHIKIETQNTSPDIEVYLRSQIELLQEDSLLPDCETETILQCLLRGAHGMFLWARLMIAYLRSPALTATKRRNAILDLKTPESLDVMYHRILQLISGKIKEEQELARHIFAWVSCGEKLLNTQELESTINPQLKVFDTSVHDVPTDAYPDFEHTVVMVSGSLVEKYAGTFRFIHKSVQDFFRTDWTQRQQSMDKFGSADSIRPTVFEAHTILASTCLSYLLFQAPLSPLSGDMFQPAKKTDIRTVFPLLEYASCCWGRHLRDSIPEGAGPTVFIKLWRPQFANLSHRLSQFLDSQLLLMSWVESIYIFLQTTRHLDLYEDLRQWSTTVEESSEIYLGSRGSKVHRERSVTLLEFCAILEQYFELWSKVLSAEPHQIWQDITAYTPSKFFRSTKATDVRSMPARRPQGDKNSIKPVATMSKHCVRKESLAILTVWASRSFEILWSDFLAGKRNVDLGEHCSNWVVRYEVGNSDSPTMEPREEYQFDLDRKEIEVQLQRYLAFVKTTHKGAQKWAFPFPIAISEDLTTFSVLLEVFRQSRCSETLHEWARLILPEDSIRRRPGGAQSLPDFQQQKHAHPLGQQDQELVIRVCPFYALKFNDSSSSVLYMEKKILNTRVKDNTTYLLAVFSVRELQDAYEFILTGSMQQAKGDAQFRFCTFHPFLPLLLYHQRTLLSGISEIQLWAYETSQHDCFPFKGGLEDLSFSACGTEIVAKHCGNPRPETRSISNSPLVLALRGASNTPSAKCRKRARRDSEDDMVSSRSLALNSVQPWATGADLAAGGFSSGQLTMSSDSVTQISYVSNSKRSKNAITLRHRSDRAEVHQTLTHLPDIDGIDEVSISVENAAQSALGDSEFDVGSGNVDRHKIRLFLNQRAADFSTMEQPLSAHLPAIVTKDVRALEPATKRGEAPRKAKTLRIEHPVSTNDGEVQDANFVGQLHMQYPPNIIEISDEDEEAEYL